MKYMKRTSDYLMEYSDSARNKKVKEWLKDFIIDSVKYERTFDNIINCRNACRYEKSECDKFGGCLCDYYQFQQNLREGKYDKDGGFHQ